MKISRSYINSVARWGRNLERDYGSRGDSSTANEDWTWDQDGPNPQILWESRSSLNARELAQKLHDAWMCTASPLIHAPLSLWVNLFEYSDYAMDGRICFRPAGDVEVYRGQYRSEPLNGLSWTRDPEWAAFHANRRGFDSVLLRASIPWRIVLARFTTREDELIINPASISGLGVIERLHENNR